MTHAKGQLVGYQRVSTADQNTDRQLDGLTLDRTFTDKASGKDTDRPQLQEALKYLREGDTLICHSMDRLARNLIDLRSIVDSLISRSVKVQFVKEGLTFTGADDAMARLMLNLMGSFAEFERSMIRERQREGIALAKKRGAYKGRQNKLTDDQAKELIAKDQQNAGKNRSALAREYEISRETLYKYLSQ